MTPADAALELLARRAARTGFTSFCEHKLRDSGMTMAAHHRLMTDALDEVERGECDRLMLMLPPGSAKSTYASVFFPEYFIGRNPQLSVICASHTSELAERFGRRVRNAVGDPSFTAMWGCGLASDSQAAGRWNTTKGGEYNTCGVGGSITGRRGDLVVIDDPVASREDADSERMRERGWEWWTNDLLTRLKPHGRVVLVMTRWHEDDLAGRILDREGKRWRVIKLPMLAGEADLLGRKPGDRLWPEWFTEDMLKQAQQDARSWISLYQQEPRPADGAEFKRGWLCRYAAPPRRANKVILVDPAGDPQANGRRKKSDYTAMWVVALGADGNAYVVDGVHDRLNLSQRMAKLFELHRKHKPLQVRYERYGMMGDVSALRAEMERRDYRFKVDEVAGAVEKNARIRRLVTWFEGGKLWLPSELMRERVDGERVDLVKRFVDDEYVTFPVGRFDDMFDCLARLDEPALSLPWPSADDDAPIDAPQWSVIDQVTGY